VYGSGFADGQVNVITPTTDVELAELVNSGEGIITLGIGQNDAGYGDRLFKTCNSDGVTGCSNSQVFGLYYQNTCVLGPSNLFCLNPQETIAGKSGNGAVDVFSLTGEYESSFFVGTGAALTSIAIDDTTAYIVMGGKVYDQSGNLASITETGFLSGTATMGAAHGGFACFLQPSINNLGCFSLTEGSSPVVTNVTVGNNPQSLAMGEVNGNIEAFVLTIGGNQPAIASVNVSSGTKTVTSKPVTGITADAPGGSAIVTLDSSGTGVIVSYTDGIAIPFSETTLTPGTAITLPGIPVNVVADTTDGVVLVGNANHQGPGGNITVVDPIKGTAIVESSDASPLLPVALVVVPSQGKFFDCPLDGTACIPFPLP